jgi:sn-glycerol 3-phosphate transport system substrate-binding protein
VANKTNFKPLHEVMREAKEKFDASKLSPELRDGLSDVKGQLFALPVAFSTPVLYVNKALFRKAGLDPENPPKTWFEAQEAAGKLADSGSRCPFTTSWPVQVFIDNVSAWDGAEVNDAKGKLAFNGLAQVKHIAMMATWYKSKYFAYFGTKDEADNRFANGECGMLTSSSSLFASLNENKSLEVGVSPLPYHDDVYGAPKNTLADGSSLWIANGMKPAETKGAAKFVNYVLGPEVQIGLTLAGGYLPMTPVARAAAGTKLLGADLGGLKIAYAQLQGKGSAPKVRVAQIEQVRQIVEEELETVWADKKPAKEALDNAVARGNAAMLKIAALDETKVAPKSKGKGKK